MAKLPEYLKLPVPSLASIPVDAVCYTGSCKAPLFRGSRNSIWFNHGNQELYCKHCAARINRNGFGNWEDLVVEIHQS